MPRFAADLSDEQFERVKRAKLDAEHAAGGEMDNAEFLTLMANDTSAKWRKGK